MITKTTAEILQELPELSRDTLYYWESENKNKKKWITSIRVKPRTGERERRVYTEEEFRKIKKIWEYYQQGLRPEKAYERACADLKNTKRA